MSDLWSPQPPLHWAYYNSGSERENSFHQGILSCAKSPRGCWGWRNASCFMPVGVSEQALPSPKNSTATHTKKGFQQLKVTLLTAYAYSESHFLKHTRTHTHTFAITLFPPSCLLLATSIPFADGQCVPTRYKAQWTRKHLLEARALYAWNPGVQKIHTVFLLSAH